MSTQLGGLSGKWSIQQQWDGAEPYTFDVEFDSSGTLKLIGTDQFFGTYIHNPDQGTLDMAIASFEDPNSITVYQGFRIWLFSFGGSQVGANRNNPNQAASGQWSARPAGLDAVTPKVLHIP